MAEPGKILIFSAFAALYLIWGSTYLAIRFAIETIPPLLMAGARFLVAGGIMYGIARWQGAPEESFANWRTALIIGGCLLLGGNGGVTLSEQYISSGLASVIVATVPIYIALLTFGGILVGEHHRFDASRISPLSIGAFAYLVLIGALVGYTAYIFLLRHCAPAKVATYAYVNPIVAVILGALFAGETLSARTVLAAALIIGSVALVITVQQTKSKPVPAPLTAL